MACHFSPYGLGLTDLPDALPPGSLLFCDDRIPILRHDPQLVARQLTETARDLECSAIVLDFQQPGLEAGARIVQAISERAVCPVAVASAYAQHCTGPVLLPPPKLWEPVTKVTRPWQGRELWMEWAIQAARITVTEDGAQYTPLEEPPVRETSDQMDTALLCHYRMELGEHHAAFLLWDDAETLAQKRTAAENAGITTLVGLYQQFHPQ